MAITSGINNKSNSFTSDTTVTATLGDITVTSGNLALTAATTSSVGQITQAGTRVFHTFGTSNTFVGAGSGNFTLTTASTVQQTALGTGSLASLTVGSNENLAVGYNSLTKATTGEYNAAVGSNSLAQLLTGNYNVGLGRTGGYSYTGSESSNICINHQGIVGESNTLRIGANNTTGSQGITTAYIHGISGVTVTGAAVLCSAAGQLGTVSSSLRYKQDIQDMGDVSSTLLKLRPVTFVYKANPEMGTQTGLIAEEVNEIMPQLTLINSEGLPESVKYHDMPAMLLNELQKAILRIAALEESIKDLKNKGGK